MSHYSCFFFFPLLLVETLIIILIGRNKLPVSSSSPKNTRLYIPEELIVVDLNVQLKYIKMPLMSRRKRVLIPKGRLGA